MCADVAKICHVTSYIIALMSMHFSSSAAVHILEAFPAKKKKEKSTDLHHVLCIMHACRTVR